MSAVKDPVFASWTEDQFVKELHEVQAEKAAFVKTPQNGREYDWFGYRFNEVALQYKAYFPNHKPLKDQK